MATRVVIYTRYSTQRIKDRNIDSCEVQSAYCEQYALKRGYEIVAQYHDRYVSGKEEDRPKMWEAIGRLQRGDVLLVWKYDRLARNVYLMELVRRAVGSRRARIEAVQGGIEGDSAESVLIRQVLAAIAEYERRIIALRTKYAMLHHQRGLRRMGRFAPFGYDIDPDDKTRLVSNEKEQVLVRKVENLSDRGWDRLRIIRKLRKDGDTNRVGKKIQNKTVDSILRMLGRT